MTSIKIVIDEEQPGDVENQLPQRTKRREKVNKLFGEYCANSSIHGVKYLGEKKRHWIERCWWIIGFAISFICCGGLIYKIFNKWNVSSVIVSFAEEPTPVWHIPFPAVTICPTTKINATMFNIIDGFGEVILQKRRPVNFSDEEYTVLNAVSQVCDAYIGEAFGQLGLGDNIADSSIVDLLKEAAPRLNETLYDSFFLNNKNYSCEFEEILTEEGLCFTFNMLTGNETYTESISPDYSQIHHKKRANWNLESGYNNNVEIYSPTTYPYRVAGSGADGDKLRLWLELTASSRENWCHGPAHGYKIVLHVPGEIPQVAKHFFLIPPLQDVSVSVKVNIIKTSEGLRHYHHERRKCYFESERKLRFLKVYTQRNCELECLSNATLQSCGCVKFSLPRDAAAPICGSDRIQCYHFVRDTLMKSSITETSMSRPCNCLPACYSITYDAQISQTPFDWNSYSKSLKMPKNESSEYLPTLFEISFKENEFITLMRSELYGPIDFAASCGGLLGLFMGASFLSIVELVYFCSLRLCCNIRTRVIQKQEVAPVIFSTSRKDKSR
ncbi:pickpocket protein 28-like [Bradysia coprophila]|uniref:pickpocket protein 28-like n=1 Tax=Bradysia coprophila TaxID=38358 RepID=UPI00187D6ECA|nr:pickpocket protein 28-like [Bradysia coprophila]